MNRTNKWSQIGAWQGGSVLSVVLSPNFEKDGIALAATSAGLFRTQSSGQTWSLAMDGFSDPSALALAYGQDKAGTILFASSEQGRLFRSSDLGATWSEMDAWAGLGIGSAIAISPDYAADKTFFVATSNGIFRTLDDGASWQEASFGLLDLDVICLVLAPDFAHSQTLWVGTALGGLFRSRNAGRAWRESGEGLPDCALQAIVLSPHYTTDHTLFAGTEEGGLYRSQDGGRSWTLILEKAVIPGESVNPGEAAGETLAAIGVNALSVLQLPSEDGDYVVFAGTTDGIYSSNDGGESWKVVLTDLPILDLALAENGAGLASVYQRGIYARDSRSGEWQPAALGIVAHAPPQVVQGSDDWLLALDSDGEMGLSKNGGAAWQALTLPDLLSPLTAIARAGSASEEGFYAASKTTLYHISTREGEWHALIEPPLAEGDVILQLAVDSASGQESIALGTAQGDLFWLDNAGRAWQKLEHPWQGVELLSIFFASDKFSTDEFARNEAGVTLHALTATENANQNYAIELWRFDGKWSSLATLESESPAVLTLSTAGSIFLATQNRLIKLFTNVDSGELEVTQHFFAENERITALAKSAGEAKIYAATTIALHCSTDTGGSWNEGCSLPTVQPIVSILPDAQDVWLAVATLGGSFWEIEQ